MIISRSEQVTAALIVSERLGRPLGHPETAAGLLTGLPHPDNPERLMGPAEAARRMRAIIDVEVPDDPDRWHR
jgi:hypothetical protein